MNPEGIADIIGRAIKKNDILITKEGDQYEILDPDHTDERNGFKSRTVIQARQIFEKGPATIQSTFTKDDDRFENVIKCEDRTDLTSTS